MRPVTAANADNTAHPSIKGSSGAPTPPIWIRWSITENHAKPWFSAHCVFAFAASNASAGSGPEEPGWVVDTELHRDRSRCSSWTRNSVGVTGESTVKLLADEITSVEEPCVPHDPFISLDRYGGGEQIDGHSRPDTCSRRTRREAPGADAD